MLLTGGGDQNSDAPLFAFLGAVSFVFKVVDMPHRNVKSQKAMCGHLRLDSQLGPTTPTPFADYATPCMGTHSYSEA